MGGVYIGIDAGVHTGFAVWDSDAKAWMELKTCSLVEALLSINHYAVFKRFKKVIIEDPNGNKPVFAERHAGETTRKMMRINQNIGANKRDAQILIDWCQYHKIAYETYVPTSKSPKWSAAYFAQLTGVASSTSQHVRDGAKLVFGR